MLINDYFLEIEEIIANFEIVSRQEINKKIIDAKFGIISGVIYFDYGILDFIEVVKIVSQNPVKTKYKYHFMTNDKIMIFRYDNTKHHPKILTFPHHKHLPNTITEATEPQFVDVLLEIYKMKE